MKNKIKCPYCGGTKINKYVYGEVMDFDLLDILSFDSSDEEEYHIPSKLGGCYVDENSPKYYCVDCDKDF